MSSVHLRLRQRVDRLTDERDALRAENERLRTRVSVLEQQVLVASLSRQSVRNQHGVFPIYATESERREARRLTWRLSYRRRKAAA